MNKLIVCFKDPFWVGIFEIIENNTLKTCRVVFGSEPKDYQVYEFVLDNYYKLIFSKPIKAKNNHNKINPKRLQRKISTEMKKKTISTKAQEAISLQRELNKLARKKKSSKQKNYMKELKFQKKQEKKKQKKKGH